MFDIRDPLLFSLISLISSITSVGSMLFWVFHLYDERTFLLFISLAMLAVNLFSNIVTYKILCSEYKIKNITNIDELNINNRSESNLNDHSEIDLNNIFKDLSSNTFNPLQPVYYSQSQVNNQLNK